MHLYTPLCKYCEYLAGPIHELWELINSETKDLATVSAETSEAVRFVADLAALGVDHLFVKHVARTCSCVMGLVVKQDGKGTFQQLDERVGTARYLDRLLNFMVRQELIRRDGDTIEVPRESLIRKVALPLRVRPGGWFEERASLFLFGYLMLAAFNEFYNTNSTEGLQDLFGTRSNSITRPATFMMALFFILKVWHEGFKQFSDSWLRAYLSRRVTYYHLLEEVRNKLIGLDSKVSVSFVKATEGKHDLFYVFDDYVVRLRERLRERERAREHSE
jgi:hypothetical protein